MPGFKISQTACRKSGGPYINHDVLPTNIHNAEFQWFYLPRPEFQKLMRVNVAGTSLQVKVP